MMLKQQLKIISKEIIDAKIKYNRIDDEIKLLAVSKTRSAEEIKSLYQLGLKAFGENYLQEALMKQAHLKDCDIEWHFIGPIQSNKTALLSQHFKWVQTICREKIAQRLNDSAQRQNKVINILVQVNLNNEDTKAGILPEALNNFCQKMMLYPHLRLRGLMAIPKKTPILSEQENNFNDLLILFNAHKNQFNFDTLSMGMSEDYPIAIKKGSTLLRIGTKLFGERKA